MKYFIQTGKKYFVSVSRANLQKQSRCFVTRSLRSSIPVSPEQVWPQASQVSDRLHDLNIRDVIWDKSATSRTHLPLCRLERIRDFPKWLPSRLKMTLRVGTVTDVTLWGPNSSKQFLHIRSVPHRKRVSATKIIHLLLMLFKDIIAVYPQNHTKRKYIVCKIQNYLLLKHMVHTVTTGL
jgi:hypothetical protein